MKTVSFEKQIMSKDKFIANFITEDGGTDVSVRAPHLLANYKVKDARLWIKLPSTKRKPLL